MKTPKELFNLIQAKVSDSNNYRKLVLAKWQEYTIEYQGGFGILGLNSRLTIWCYNRVVMILDCKRLTTNDPNKIKSWLADEGTYIHKLMDAIEGDQIVSIGSIQQLWRITIGGYIASKRSKLASKGD